MGLVNHVDDLFKMALYATAFTERLTGRPIGRPLWTSAAHVSSNLGEVFGQFIS